MYEKIVSIIYNSIVGGLSGFTSNPNISRDQIEEEVVIERQNLIKKYIANDLLPRRDLLIPINCIQVDCMSLDKCDCIKGLESPPVGHFEIPQLINDFEYESLEYVGSSDKRNPFKIYYSFRGLELNKYRKSKKKRPFVFVDTTPNRNSMYDCFIFDAPFIKQLSVIGIFKDVRQLENYGCCSFINEDDAVDPLGYLNKEIISNVTAKYLTWYKAPGITPNDQKPK